MSMTKYGTIVSGRFNVGIHYVWPLGRMLKTNRNILFLSWCGTTAIHQKAIVANLSKLLQSILRLNG